MHVRGGIARRTGLALRRLYCANLDRVVDRGVESPRSLEATVMSFSCQRDLPEQVAAIRSFVGYVGRPRRFVVVSDGTYPPSSKELIKRTDACVSVIEYADFVDPEAHAAYGPNERRRYPTDKKLAFWLSIPVEGPTIVADSDVLFFPRGDELAALVSNGDAHPHFLRDCAPALDSRLLDTESEHCAPANSGFLVIKERLNWTPALERLSRLDYSNFHTEQTVVHLALRASGGEPLPADKYVVTDDDARRLRDHHCKGIVLRHFTAPVRYKLWYHLRHA